MKTGQISILLIDDDEEDFLITEDLLGDITHQSYHLDWVHTYEDAQKELDRQAHDLYLVDYRLGIHSSLGLLKEARKKGYTKPMILLTGQGDPEVDAQAMREGAADFLVKGHFSADQLERSIRYAIQQAANLTQIRSLNAELEERVQRRTLELQLANEELSRSQWLYHSMANQFPSTLIAVLDPDMNLLLADGQELEAFGETRETMLGKSVYSLFEPDTHEKLTYFLQRVFGGESLDFDMHRKDQIYLIQGVPLNADGLESEQILIVFRNITLEKQAETEIKHALNKERQLNELKSRFISMASHEFRTPLSTILSSVSLIEKYTQTEQQPNRAKHVDRIKANVRNLTSILEDFLSISKLEEGKMEVRPSEFDLVELIQEVCEEMQSLAKPGQDLHIEAELDKQVHLDKHLTRNILLNLISNAIKYSGPDSRIHINLTDKEPHLKLSVKDEGIGIAEEEQIHLFERFYRAHNATHIQGTGLGLNIVHKYVSLMQGVIEFESEIDRGTTFTVTLPIQLPSGSLESITE
ncbi:ATP-binding protein [Pontibacter sp. G13]|uniref:sensor histidine kinase n=1 Tax=Pontibacter sp. G13 TaxID=3074898 RepID=UPI002889390A|nr:ATP-binding protein [Pontibacter sp. G13]WNJ17773.1 ATP-binding protein [Pontibacter sp. G13]